jgi:hypothetical protein
MTRWGTTFRLNVGRPPLIAALVVFALTVPAAAQMGGPPSGSIAPRSLTGPMPGSGTISPSPGFGSPGASLVTPGVAGVLAPPFGLRGSPPAHLPPFQGSPAVGGLPTVAPGQVGLSLSARFGEQGGEISDGLNWRIYSDRPDKSGRFHVVKEERAAAPVLALPPGGYIVHVNIGLASASKHVQLRAETVRESFALPAGGIRVEGRVGGVRIPAGQIAFDILPGSQFDPGEKQAVARKVMTGDVVVLPEGTYHIVSNYGDANAVIRSDIRVQAGKLTDVTVTHHAAIITLKLVGGSGGGALANTAWSVLTPGGDVVKEAMGAFPRVILAEGDYRVMARNDGKVYERAFKVSSGVDGEIEVLAH